MNIFRKSTLAFVALLAVVVLGAWVSLDAVALSFNPSSVIVHADDYTDYGGSTADYTNYGGSTSDYTNYSGGSSSYSGYSGSSDSYTSYNSYDTYTPIGGSYYYYGTPSYNYGYNYNNYNYNYNYQNNPTPPPTPTCSLWATPQNITGTGNVTLNWTSSNAASGSINQGVGSLNYPIGYIPVYGIGSTMTFTGTFLNSAGVSVNCSTTVTVTPPPAPTCTLDAVPSTINSGGSSSLSWTTANATSASIDQSVGAVTPVAAGATSVSPSTTTTYTLTATGAGGTVTCSKTVTVTPPPPPPGNGCIQVLKETFDPSGTKLSTVAQFSFKLDGGTTIQNDANGNAVFNNVTPGVHQVTEVPAGPTWNLLSVTPASGNVTVASGPVCAGVVFKNQQVIPGPPAPTCTLDAVPSTINSGGSSSLSWTTANATSASIDQSVGAVTPVAAGATSVSPSTTTTYTLTATGAGGTVTCSKTVTVTPPPPPPGNGCIQVLKETFDPSGTKLSTVAQFSFKLDGGTTIQNDANGNAVFNNVTPGVHQVTEVPAGPTWNLLSVTPASGNVTVASGPVCAGVVFKNQQVVVANPPPSCTLTATPNSFSAPGSTTLAWTSANATSATINNSVGSVSPVSAGTVAANVSASTTFVMTVTGPGGTQTCQAPVTVTTSSPNPSCSLSVSASSINTGQSVVLSWISANVSSGSIDNNIGATSPVAAGSTTVFPPSSTTFTGTFTGPNGTVTCSVPLTVNTGGGGCTTNCGGGGLNQPDVALYQQANPQPLAFVSLSQIPYTGFEAGPALTMIFWLAIGLLSALIAYAIVGKGATRYALAYVLGTAAGVPVLQDYGDEEYSSSDYGRAYPASEGDALPNIQQRSVSLAAAPAPRAATAPAIAAIPVSRAKAIPDIVDVIESRAHAAGVLMSPEAASLAADLSDQREEALRMFGDILTDAVHTIPREDGWIMLTADRLRERATKYPTAAVGSAATPVPVSLGSLMPADANAGAAFAGAVVSQDREGAFSLIRQLEQSGGKSTALMTATATALDQLYRARQGGHSAPDLVLADKAAHVSNDQLERLVAVFTHALDHVYASPFTGVKLALAQAFEVIG